MNVTLYDGSGGAPRRADVRIAGDRIAEVAAAGSLGGGAGVQVIDGRGLAIAPGFIDTHSHHDRGLFEEPAALGAVSQGVTTIVVGQDGGSQLPLADFFARLEREPVAVNVASYVGHGTVRDAVMGEDFRRDATPDEVERMRVLVRREMSSGALGLSTGLEYDPGIYSDPSEVLALAQVAAERGGRYISHIRSEDRDFWQAVDEVITIGRETRMPVQISHLKLAMRSSWGLADSLLRVLDHARTQGIDLTADIYPYTYWQSGLTVLFPSRDFNDRAAAEFALREVVAPDGLVLTRFTPEPSYDGKTLAEIARLRGTEPVETLLWLVNAHLRLSEAGGSSARIIATGMLERDVARLMQWPHANICSDGELAGRHPRGFGSFTRVLGRYARDGDVMPIEEAIRKMTSLSAEHLGIQGRGKVVEGHAADLVLFDPATVEDRATPEAPQALSVGIHTVWVNGRVVFEAGRPTGERAGRVIRR